MANKSIKEKERKRKEKSEEKRWKKVSMRQMKNIALFRSCLKETLFFLCQIEFFAISLQIDTTPTENC